jgi:hypothetical protein
MHLAGFQKKVKIIGGGILVLTVLGGVVVAGKSTSSFMAKASACPAQNVRSAQVTANSAVINWTTSDPTQGKIEYGTNSTNLTFSQVEGASGTTHNVPLTLLTPNTVYYYLVTIGDKRCDYSGQACGNSCVPWSFTTSSIGTGGNAPIVVSNTPAVALLSPTRVATVSPTAKFSSPVASPSSTLSPFCANVQKNLGKNSNSPDWATAKQYDQDGNNIINGLDVIKCQRSGK